VESEESMGKVKVGDEVIDDRRHNGARIKLDTGDWLKVATVVIAIIITGGRIQMSVANNCKDIEKHKEQIASHSEQLAKTGSDIANIKESLIYIRGKVDTLVLGVKK
jgi:gas vesicle protein